MKSRIGFLLRRLEERLWVKPAAYCVLAVLAALVAHGADFAGVGSFVPKVTPETIEVLLSIVSSSMLTVATFAVASMISAYASASQSATPRAFALVVADNSSKQALSSFIGAFIFSIVAIIALRTGYYGRAGHFALFALTLMIFAWVVMTFVRWVDAIARLGRVQTTISAVEGAAGKALCDRRLMPVLGGVVQQLELPAGVAIHAREIGYVQHLTMAQLQTEAERCDLRLHVLALPGTFVGPDQPLLVIEGGRGDADIDCLRGAFLIDPERSFDQDPRFGLIVLSEIAARALSPGVNDPGTAISVIGVLLRLFTNWARPLSDEERSEVLYDRVSVPCLNVDEMLGDAFTAIARDGAGSIDVGVRLQKALHALASLGDAELREAAIAHAGRALGRAEQRAQFADDIERLRALAKNCGD